jgi:surface polysaccharide O-acyltransferase-like enzyme
MQQYKEKFMKGVFFAAALTSVLAMALICLFLFKNGIPAMAKIGFDDFLLGRIWKPNDIPASYGILPMIMGSFAVTFGGTVAASFLSGIVNVDFMEGMSPGPALMSIGLFGAVRILADGKESSSRLALLTKASFCIYLIHHFFIMMFRYISIDVLLFAPIVEIPIETAAVFALSLAGWWVLSKIPFVKDHLI